MSERDDIAWEEQQRLRQKMHDTSARLAAFEMSGINRDEKIEDLREDLDKIYDANSNLISRLITVENKVSDLQGTIKTYNKFMWGLAITVLGTLITAIAEGRLN
jgi:chromosome segregation ATPase